MDKVLRRERGNKAAAFAAIVATCLLAACVLVAAGGGRAFAAELQGKGTADEPTLIYNTADLIAWCNSLNGMGDAEFTQHARLMNDLTGPGPDGTEYGGAITNSIIDQMNHPDLRVAEFDGNGHVVELQLDGNDANGHGALFKTGGLPNGDTDMKIKDFHFIGSVTHAHVDNNEHAGTLFETVGTDYDRQLTILDCTNQAYVYGDQATGGFIGSFIDKAHGAITIKRCSNFGDIMSANGHAGGIAGSIEQYGDSARDGSVTYCSNNGMIKSWGGSFKTNTYPNSLNPDKDKPETIGGSAGGLVGYLAFEDKVRFSLGHDYNQGEIYSFSGLGYSGGLVGFTDTPYTISHYVLACYNSGPIQPLAKTAERVGGIFGYSSYGTLAIDNSLTEDDSVPPDAVSDITHNGTIAYKGELWDTTGLRYLDYDVYMFGRMEMYKHDNYPLLKGVGIAREIEVTLISPMTGEIAHDYAYWNMPLFPDGIHSASEPEGYRVAYWTLEKPDEGGTWKNPPKEFKSSDPNNIHECIHGGDITLYAYCVPSSATVKFDLNKPDGYNCSMDPTSAQKVIVEGEPVGALPTCTSVSYNDKKDTRAFLGWATMSDGNDPKAEWISENSDNLYDFVDGNHEVTLYAQWANASLPFEILRQPENYTVPAVAEGVPHEAWFEFYTTYPESGSYDYWAQLQYRKDRNSSYKEVENLRLSAAPNQFFFDIESADEAIGDYRIKIDYYENGNLMGTRYTSSANIVMDIPQSEAEVTSIALGEDSEQDEVLGTHSYDVSLKITGDSKGEFPALVGDSPDKIEHKAWIEGGPDNILPEGVSSSRLSIDNVHTATLKDQHLKEGQTYTLCVSRLFHDSAYKGESEPYRVPFVVPYADSVAASITPVQVTEQPVVQDGKAVNFTADYKVRVNASFNLASDVQYPQPQPENRNVAVQWQYSLGDGWVDMPDSLLVQDKDKKPIRGIAWSDDRTSARVHATLKANATLNGAVFRVRLTTPPTPTDAISDQSTKKLSLSVPLPEITDLKVTNDTHLSLTWKWQDGAGNTLPTEGSCVKIERYLDFDNWEEVSTDRVYTYTYDATLDPQQKYRVSVSADTEGLHGSFTDTQEFTTSGETGITWEDDYGVLYTPSQNRDFYFNVDFDWADYNDGEHVALYTWYLSREKYADTMFDEFITTETDDARFPDGFMTEDVKNGTLWSPLEAQWVWVKAAVYKLDDNGNPADEIPETIRWASTLPIIHNTTEPQNMDVTDEGSHSMTVSWDAPAEGLVREYRVSAGGSHSWIVPSEASEDGHYTLKADGLNDWTSYGVHIETIDSRISPSTIAMVSGWGDTLHSPEVGTWTATAEADNNPVKLGDEVTLSATYQAKSGNFPTENIELQWYSWREGDAEWQPEGAPVTPQPPLDDKKEYTTTLMHNVTSNDYGRQWKLGVKASTLDETVTGSSSVATVAITPPAPTNVACGTPAPTSIPVSWTPVADAEGYQIKCAKLDASGNPVSAITYSAAASSLTKDDAGTLHYELMDLDPETTYRVSVASFTRGVSSEFVSAPDAATLAVPTIDSPVFSQVPKTAWVEAGKEATFTAQASVGDGGGAISYVWQRKGLGEQGFTSLEDGDTYAISTDAATGVTTLTVKSVSVENAAAAFRCVATNSKDGQTAESASAAAYLAVTPVKPTDAKAWATSPTTGEATWTAEGAVRRFMVRWQQMGDSSPIGPEYSKVVTLAADETQGRCQIDGLLPNSKYSVLIDPAPQAGLWPGGLQVQAPFTTPPASALETATVTMSPDKTLVEPGTPVTFTVATNVDSDVSEAQEYRWQRNAFGEGWYDVDGANAATLNVTAPEGGVVEGYRCVVTSTKESSVEVKDQKTVTSDVKLLATNVPVAQPVHLAAEAGIASAHLSWSGDDVRPAAYEVQYAEGPTPGDDAWTTVENVGTNTSCDVEGLTPNTVYSWRVKAVVRDGLLQSDWALADTFTTFEEPSALSTVSVTPRFGVTVAGSGEDVTYTATTNIDNALNGETLSYQWQTSATGDEWIDLPGQTKSTTLAAASDKAPRSCLYRCVVTTSKDGVDLKTVTSEPASFHATPQIPTALVAKDITAATADLSWTGSLTEGLSYRVFWRVSGAADWQSATDLTEATYTLNSLMPATTYEWYVQVMNDGAPSVRSATSLFVTQSLSPVPTLTRVVVDPLDQTPSATEQAKLTAYTNVDDMLDAGATLAYRWEMRNLDSNPDDPNAWMELSGKDTREITIDQGAVGYVRCTVTYTPPTGALALPSINTPVTSTNEARVRVMPASPADLAVAAGSLTQTSAKLTWTGDAAASDIVYDVTYSVVGSGAWQHVSVAGTEAVLDDLAPNTAYEWNVRAVAYGASDPLGSDWVTGPVFTTAPEEIVLSRVEVTPSAPSVMAGAEDTVTLTATPDATDPDNETLAYQWQRYDGSEWQPIDGATSDKLEVAANDLSVGTHAYRCEVTAMRDGVPPKPVVSNESVVTAMPAAPTPLFVDDIHSADPTRPLEKVAATFHWEWGDDPLPEGTTFEVSYRKLAGYGSYLDGWLTKDLIIDNENRTCVVSSLDAPDLTYQWRVRVVQNGATSPWSEAQTFITTLKEPVNLTFVEVTPSDSLVSNDESAAITLTASTNVDDDPNKGTLTYEWQWCELTTQDPRSTEYEKAWKAIEGATSSTITLSNKNKDTNRFVRCKVTQTIDGVAGNPVASNPACVRTEPLPPYDLSAKVTTDGGITLTWKCDDVRAENSEQKNVIGYEMNYRKVGTNEWAEEICNSKSCALKSSLEPGATYEWRVRTILSSDVRKPNNTNTKLAKGGPHTEWVDGAAFTTAKVDVTPARAAAVIGSGRTLTFTASPNDVATGGGRETYEWQRQDGRNWVTVPGATSKTLSIPADDATAAGTSKYRCQVGANNDHTTSNEVTCTLAPAAPTNLVASSVTSSEATLTWNWTKGGLQSADAFNVFYRESSAKEWTTAEAVGMGDDHELTIQDLKPETAYEWRVQAVQNGTSSLPSSTGIFATASEHPALKLESVLIEPANQAVAPTAQAMLTATTNLDNMVTSGLTYKWEKRALAADNKEESWEEISGATNSNVTLDAGTTGYVRCTVTYAPAPTNSVTSNEACIRVQPGAAPTDPKVDAFDDTTATFSWSGTLPLDGSFSLSYRAVGTDEWTMVPGIAESSYQATGLAPNTTYEWRVRAVSASGMASAWVDGAPVTTTSPDSGLTSVTAAPSAVTAVAGQTALVDGFVATVSGTIDPEKETLAYQWQVCVDDVNDKWANLPGETGSRTHLSVTTLEAGNHSLRCVVTATAAGGKQTTVESDPVTLALAPMLASGLEARNVQADAATLAWTWAGPGSADSFTVQYREEGASEWTSASADKINAATMTCAIDGLASGMSYEWQVQAVQNGQASEWAVGGFVTPSSGSLKIARIWPPDVAVATGEQAEFAAFTNRGIDAEGITYEWQYRSLDSADDESSWELIEGEADRVVTLDANTTGYVRCVATQAPSGADVVGVAEVTETPEVAGTDNATERNEASEVNEANEALEGTETGEAVEAAETFAAPTPVVVVSNQARVRVAPGVPSGLAVGEVGYRDAALSWAPADVAGSTFTLAYRATGTDAWTELSGLTDPSHVLGGLVPGTPYDWRVQAVVGEGDDALTSEWANGDSFTTLALKTYPVIAGADGTWKPGQSGLAFTIDAVPDKFLSLEVDGVELARGTDYTVADEGMTVTLSPDYLARLAAGKHALVAMFTDGMAQAAFAVASDQPDPAPAPDGGGSSGSGGATLAPTGDPLGAALPTAGTLAAVCAALAVLAALRRRARR